MEEVDRQSSFVEQFHFENSWFLFLVIVIHIHITLLFCGARCIGLDNNDQRIEEKKNG